MSLSDITVHEAFERRATTQFLDVREDFEVAESMIPGSLHIPIGQLNERLGELDAAVEIITVCRSGNRSGQVADALNAAGFSAHNMAGGIIAWQQAGLPTS